MYIGYTQISRKPAGYFNWILYTQETCQTD